MKDPPTATTKPVDEEVGWEDWDEDQRRALGKSHLRVIASLKEYTERNARPQQIVPLEIDLQKGGSESRRKGYLNKRCLVMCSVGLLAVAGITSAIILLPHHGALPPQEVLFPNYSVSGSMLGLIGHRKWSPPQYKDLLSDVDLPINNVQPLLWTMPRSGSLCVMDILSYCVKLTLSNGAGRGHDEEESLTIFTEKENIAHFANVDTTTFQGLKRAERLGLIESGLIQVLATPHLPEASNLFQNKAKTGRVFAIFRDPVSRAVSDYHFLRSLDLDDPLALPEVMSLSQFVESEHLRTNVLTKTLANIVDNTFVTEVHVMFAKQVLQEKILVGLAENFDESLNRFLAYFGWVLHDSVCAANFKAARDTRESHPHLNDEQEEYHTLRDRNWADVEVYEFAKLVFAGQKQIKIRSD